MQCSHEIQAQAQKCDGVYINFDAVYQRDSKFTSLQAKPANTNCTYRLNLLWRAKPAILMPRRTIYTSAYTQDFKIH